jgi:serine/threonine protein kinase
MDTDGLHASDGRCLEDYDERRALVQGRNTLLLAKYDGVAVCLKAFPVQGSMRGYENEVVKLRRLQHPYIIRYAAAFEDGGHMHLQMEYHAQGSLRAWIGDVAPAPERRRTVLRQVRYY